MEAGSRRATTRGIGPVARRLSRHPAVQLTWILVAVAVLVAPDRLEAFVRSLPAGLLAGAFGVVLLWKGVPSVARFVRTSDPFTATGWNRWRGREVTTFEPHIWWGIFGAIGVVGGIALLIYAASELT